MLNIRIITFAVLLLSPASAAGGETSTAPKAGGSQTGAAQAADRAGAVRQLEIANKPWKGDFDAMLERRMIRVYSPYSRSLYFVDKGRERGIGAELIRDFERWVNQKYAKQLGKRPLTVYIVAATRDKLLSDLNDGLADIAVGNLTVTTSASGSSTSWRPTRGSSMSRSLRRGRRRRRSPRSTICRARPCMCARRRAITRALHR